MAANFIPGSPNGKAAAFDSAYDGSIPSLGANYGKLNRQGLYLFAKEWAVARRWGSRPQLSAILRVYDTRTLYGRIYVAQTHNFHQYINLMKHIIIILLGLIPIALIIGAGLLYHFGLWIYLIVALVALVYPIGLWVGNISFRPKE